MQVRILPFGILKESLGSDPFALDLPGGATVADLLARLGVQAPAVESLRIAVSVNAEYADRTRVLSENDEVGLLPPVSGGSAGPDLSFLTAPGLVTAVGLYRSPIESAEIIKAIKHAEDGAVVVFDGIVRNNSKGRPTLYLDYEAYEEMADKQMRTLAQEAIAQFGVRQVIIVHRLGRLHDLKRKRQVGGARHSGQIALHFRIACESVGEVFFLPGGRLRQVRNLVAFDHAESGRRRSDRAQLRDRPCRGRVSLDVPVRGVEYLPDAAQIGMAVGGARRSISGSLCRGCCCQQAAGYCGDERV